ncbi:Oidioi.mRNA.OKI2018_I69.chr1.g1554.t1.cds [Oikopleura dioica]|uniref:Oidioi.mRNA.OKI2018_I69.chr1.g1554.t1.cds n=1 Tax=Oikopleura dioica TaxID=34765 RepID=A0ABN7SN98_OIKDI|nr:Oidioi.mRNA.OKI2018_I69.chr1.g1554.t1.cds [Oikopleura dioica]
MIVLQVLLIFQGILKVDSSKDADEPCPDADIQVECIGLCRAEYNRCRLLCETEYCQSICDREYQNCRDYCPCGEKCKEGCVNCEHPMCPEIPCDDPCEGRENCETFIDDCAINPSRENLITTVIASVNHVTSVDVLCTHVESSTGMNFVHMTNMAMSGNAGQRFFALYRQPDCQSISLSFAYPEICKFFSQADDFECVPGEWNTFKLEQRQDENDPALTNIVVSIDDTIVAERVAATHRVLKGDELNVYASNKWNDAAVDYSIRNFFYQTFDEINYEPCVAVDPCEGKNDCTTFVDSCEMQPSYKNQCGRVTAEINIVVSAEVKCSHDMELGDWTNILQLTSSNLQGNPGQRFFMLLRHKDNQQLQLSVDDPSNDKLWSGSGYFDCVPGEWQTWRYERTQNSENPIMTDLSVSLDGVTVFSNSVRTDNVYANDDLDVYLSNRWHIAGSAYAVRNFYYQTSPKIHTVTDQDQNQQTKI